MNSKPRTRVWYCEVVYVLGGMTRRRVFYGFGQALDFVQLLETMATTLDTCTLYINGHRAATVALRT